jgi:hypothetical protein
MTGQIESLYRELYSAAQYSDARIRAIA